jgi:hypothetical protein
MLVCLLLFFLTILLCPFLLPFVVDQCLLFVTLLLAPDVSMLTLLFNLLFLFGVF